MIKKELTYLFDSSILPHLVLNGIIFFVRGISCLIHSHEKNTKEALQNDAAGKSGQGLEG